MRIKRYQYLPPVLVIRYIVLLIIKPPPSIVAATLKMMSKNVRVPNPSNHFSALTIPIGPALRNLVIPKEALTNESENENHASGPKLRSPRRVFCS